MTDVTATASLGIFHYGVYNNSSSPTMTDVTAKASGGAYYDRGVYNASSSPLIKRSTMDGDLDGLYADGDSTATVSQSTIVGGVGGDGGKTCVACDNGSGAAWMSIASLPDKKRCMRGCWFGWDCHGVQTLQW